MPTANERRSRLHGGGTSTQASSRFQYRQRGADTLQERQQSYAQGGRDNFVDAAVQTYTPGKGDNWVRVLPPTWDGATHYGMEVYVHYGIGPDRQAYLCPYKNKGEHCPICDERTELARQGQDEAAGELRPTFRIGVWILNRKEPEKGPMVWLMPYRIDQELVTLSQDKRTGEVLWIDDPNNGYDVEFTRTGEGIHTQYTGIRIARNPSPLNDDKALDFVVEHPLPGVFIYSDLEAIERALAGTSTSASVSAPAAAPAPAPAATTAVGRRPVQQPSRASYSAEQVLDAALRAADTYGIDIPDALSDPEVGPHVAKQLGDKVKEYPELQGL